MMVGGYLFATDGWAVGGTSMIPAGPLISIAFALARRSSRPKGPVAAHERIRHILIILVGMPSAGSGVGFITSTSIMVLTLAAGAVMSVAGYAAAAWSLVMVVPLLLASGLIITTAFALIERTDRRGRTAIEAAS
jgi:hypothetical protein